MPDRYHPARSVTCERRTIGHGGIFAYGDAGFSGSAGSLALGAPIVGMTSDAATGGYWLLGSDGGVFAYDAPFFGAQ
jgi:hypothetical protein